MKIETDIDKLSEKEEIPPEKCERLKARSAPLARSLCRNIGGVFAVIFWGLGLAVLFPGPSVHLGKELGAILEQLPRIVDFVGENLGPAACFGLAAAVFFMTRPAEFRNVAAACALPCVGAARDLAWFALSYVGALLMMSRGPDLRSLVTFGVGLGVLLFCAEIFARFGADPLAVLAEAAVAWLAARSLKAWNQK